MLRISGGQTARSIASMFFSETLLTAGLGSSNFNAGHFDLPPGPLPHSSRPKA